VTIGLIAIGGIAVLFAIGLASFFTYKHFSHTPVAVAAAAALPSVAPPPVAATPFTPMTDVLRPLSDPNHAGSPTPAAPVVTGPQVPLKAATAPTPAVAASQNEQKTDTAPDDSAKALAKAARKSLEKKREVAERKRARLERMYQNHEISTAEYNEGEQEYKDEIQKYRKEINSVN